MRRCKRSRPNPSCAVSSTNFTLNDLALENIFHWASRVEVFENGSSRGHGGRPALTICRDYIRPSPSRIYTSYTSLVIDISIYPCRGRCKTSPTDAIRPRVHPNPGGRGRRQDITRGNISQTGCILFPTSACSRSSSCFSRASSAPPMLHPLPPFTPCGAPAAPGPNSGEEEE